MIGDLPQSKRLAIMKSFKEGKVQILVATDVAARGIDVDDLAMVINFDLPVEAENYVHRIGRTARAGKTGKAYTFCSEQDVYNLPAIERYIEMQIPATVAYPEQMEEDKSAGMYIKTENWRGDDDYDNRGGYRKGKDGDIHNKRRDDRNGHGKHGGKDGYHGRDSYGNGKKSDYKKSDYKKSDYKKDGYKGSNYKSDYKKGGKGKGSYEKHERKPYINPEKLAGLSYEERMKLYKEAYGAGTSAKNTSKNTVKKQGSYNNKAAANQKAPEQKKSFWQKVKSFFGR